MTVPRFLPGRQKMAANLVQTNRGSAPTCGRGGQHWIVPPAGTGRVRLLQSIFQSAGLEAPTRFTRTDSVTMLFETIRLGAAVGWATVELLADGVGDGLVMLDIPELAAERQATITLRRRTRPSPLAVSLIEEVRRIAAIGYVRHGRAS